ncbi:MAG: hypothetical protein HRT88_13950 [Lentisphaeraceae bacterium]|nr:hypothetical protein [Lentisphaeraceae bacterium]
MKKFLLIPVFILSLLSCGDKIRKTPEEAQAMALLHGKWKSVSIRSSYKNPPVEMFLTFTAYAPKLTYLKMESSSKDGQKQDATIVVRLDKRGYIVPSIKKQLEDKPDSFIKYHPKHRREIAELEWEYSVSGTHLTIEMQDSKVIFIKIDDNRNKRK